ncbi:MAG: S9 family peptidase [Pyrinomonadaceae bacterium]|nr:S9 family peptidase [Pyrinomonadaceae bacterium]
MTMAQTNPNAARPPVARKIPKQTSVHGDTLTDNYFWLREKTNNEVTAYLEAENAYADAVTKPTEDLQANLYKEMLARIKETDTNVPYRFGDHFYYSRTEQGKQYPIMCRRRESPAAPEEITLDLNELAKGHSYLGLGAYVVSDDGNLLAYSTDTTGYRQYTLYVKDLRTGQLLPDRIERTVSVLWATDNKTIFYSTEDPAKRPYRLLRHTLGGKEDALVYEEKDEIYRVLIMRSRDKKYVFVGSASSETTEFRFIPTDQPSRPAQLMLPREFDHEYYPDHHNGLFYIRTNDKAKNFRLVSAPAADSQKKNWKEVIAHREKVKLEDIDLFARHCVVGEREDGLQKLRIIDLQNNKTHYVEFPEPAYTIFGAENAEFDTTAFRFRYQSLVTPASVFDYEMNTRERKLLKRTEVLGGYDPAGYTSERIFATASDGTRIPISLVYKKGLKRDGRNPMLLYAYGSYGYPLPITFNSARLSLLDRGFIYAQAHIRGGGDLGEQWHDMGKMMQKRNTFTDFIAAAEHLIAEKYTLNDKLVISGGSAGGLLMGAVANMRPDLFKVVLSYVPFVDVVNTMLDASLPLTVGEYLEWGNPNEKQAYEYIKSYDPYTNIAPKNYPTIMVRASLNDSQVPYWEAAKYVAKLRATKTSNNLLLLKTNMGAGHGGASGRYDALKDSAYDYAFILSQFGITE